MKTGKNHNTVKDYNQIIPLEYRKKLNKQKNQEQLRDSIEKNGTKINIYRYVIGLGVKHLKEFNEVINQLCIEYSWIKKKHIRFIINELIVNTQFSMLREVVGKSQDEQKVPAYFYLSIMINDEFISAGIDEFGDFFDYNTYYEKYSDSLAQLYTNKDPEMMMDEEQITDLNGTSENKLKLMLTPEDELIVPDASNKIALHVIENATDHDFFISTFHKNGKYMWKRIYFRIENENLH